MALLGAGAVVGGFHWTSLVGKSARHLSDGWLLSGSSSHPVQHMRDPDFLLIR